MASIPLLLKELDWDFTSFLFVNLLRESVTKLHGESSSNGFIRECKFGDVHAYWGKDLNSKTSLNEGILNHCIILFYFIFKKHDAICTESIHHNLGVQ